MKENPGQNGDDSESDGFVYETYIPKIAETVRVEVDPHGGIVLCIVGVGDMRGLSWENISTVLKKILLPRRQNNIVKTKEILPEDLILEAFPGYFILPVDDDMIESIEAAYYMCSNPNIFILKEEETYAQRRAQREKWKDSKERPQALEVSYVLHRNPIGQPTSIDLSLLCSDTINFTFEGSTCVLNAINTLILMRINYFLGTPTSLFEEDFEKRLHIDEIGFAQIRSTIAKLHLEAADHRF